MRYSIIFAILCLVAACQHSPQKRYYVLSPIESGSPATKSNETIDTIIGIGPIELADYLKRPNMVRMRDNNTLNLTTNDYWAEPLDKGIERILALNLTRYNPSRMIQSFPWRRDSTPVYSFRLQIHDLVLQEDEAIIDATWELIDNTRKESIVRQHFMRQIDAGSSAKAMAEAYSQLLGQLAEAMNNALVTLAPSDPPR